MFTDDDKFDAQINQIFKRAHMARKEDDVADVVLGENAWSAVIVRHPFKNSSMDEIVESKKMLDHRATTVVDLLRHWGMVAGKSAGEDSQGRAAIGLMPETEVVDRAIKITELAFAEMERRGWVYDLDRSGLKMEKPADETK